MLPYLTLPYVNHWLCTSWKEEQEEEAGCAGGRTFRSGVELGARLTAVGPRVVVVAVGRLDSGARRRVVSTRRRVRYNNNQAYSEYKHVLANILRSLFVARTPPVEARSAQSRLPQ